MDRRVGLCEQCRHVRDVRSERGSQFFLCRRAETELGFVKYPRLPVLDCPGYEPRDAQGDGSR